MNIKMGIGGMLFLIFLVLRLTDQINWAWYWVAAPLWIPLGLGLAIVISAGVIAAIVGRRTVDAVKRR